MATLVYFNAPDQNDIDSVCLCCWKEARGDGNDAMQAVMEVIFNRALDWQQTWHNVVYGKNQFSSMSIPSDPEFNLEPKFGDAQYAFCKAEFDQKAKLFAKPGLTDEAAFRAASSVKNAHYYVEPEEATSGWFFDNIVKNTTAHPFIKKVGTQCFYV